jgi:hypothetical protein
MGPKLIMSAFAIFMIGTTLACICSGVWIGQNETDIIDALASFNTMEVQSGGVWDAPKTIRTYWDALVTALSWDYPYLEGSWAYFIKIPLWIVSIGVVWGIIQVFVSVIQGLVGMVRSIL